MKRKLDLSRDKAFLQTPEKWPQQFFELRGCCMKTHPSNMKQRFGLVFSDKPLTVHVNYDKAPLKTAYLEEFGSIDALLEVWMVD